MRSVGSQVSVELHKTNTEVVPATHLAYLSLIDFVPDREPYQLRTTIDIQPAGEPTTVVMTIDALHDETWTQRYRAHRAEDVDNLGAALKLRTT